MSLTHLLCKHQYNCGARTQLDTLSGPLQTRSPLWRALRRHRGRLRTVATANAKLGEHSLTPRPPSETGTLATHSGKNEKNHPKLVGEETNQPPAVKPHLGLQGIQRLARPRQLGAQLGEGGQGAGQTWCCKWFFGVRKDGEIHMFFLFFYHTMSYLNTIVYQK